MILVILNSGVEALQYGLQNSIIGTILIVELTFALFGIGFGIAVHSQKKYYICLTIPGVVGCLLFVFINVWGGKVLGEEYMWLPFFAEDLVVFTVISYIALYFKKRIKQKKE